MTISWTAFDGFDPPPKVRRGVTWAPVTAWLTSVERHIGAERAVVAQLRRLSDHKLADLAGDPSAHDWTGFLPLRRDREEDWSDWLAQLLADSVTGRFAFALFGSIEDRQIHTYIRPEVHREVPWEGYRSDLVVAWSDDSYSHIEVKVGDASLRKTGLTAAKMEQWAGRSRQRRSDSILLLPSQVDDWAYECTCDPQMGERIVCITWIDVALALRRTLPVEVGESVRWRVWAHAFCGAIEQDLLRMRSGLDPFEWAKSLGFSQLKLATHLLGAVNRNARL